jgi:hypothetical protein
MTLRLERPLSLTTDAHTLPLTVVGVVARTLPITSPTAAAIRDSVYIVINPETPAHALHMAGMFVGDSVTGEWVAESFLGGGGTFILRRRD